MPIFAATRASDLGAGTSLQPQLWALAYLQLIGLAAGAVTLCGIGLYFAANTRRRRLGTALALRLGVPPGSAHWATLAEVAALLASGLVVGVGPGVAGRRSRVRPPRSVAEQPARGPVPFRRRHRGWCLIGALMRGDRSDRPAGTLHPGPSPRGTAARCPLTRARAGQRCTDLVQIYRSPQGGVTVLRGIDATFASGTLTAVVGASGAGKSTLLRLLACLEAPSAGQVTIAGQPTSHLTVRSRRRLVARRIGYVFQRPADNLIEYLTVTAHLRLAWQMRASAHAARPGGPPGSRGPGRLGPQAAPRAVRRPAAAPGHGHGGGR